MDKASETWISVVNSAPKPAGRDACLVLIYPTGPGMGTRYALTDKPLVIGRGAEADIHIPDHSVSRRHARIQPGADGYYALDLQSTNGTFVNNEQVAMYRLQDGDYLRVGNGIYRFLAGGNLEAEYHEEIYRLTIIDALTEIHNKRYLLEFLDRELARSERHRRPLALIMFDIDHFKAINDQYGHLGGTTACGNWRLGFEAPFARRNYLLATAARSSPWSCRKRPWRELISIAERIRLLVAEPPFQYEDHVFTLTVSLGVASTSGEDALSPPELIRRVDERLYQAKHEGRNCVVK